MVHNTHTHNNRTNAPHMNNMLNNNGNVNGNSYSKQFLMFVCRGIQNIEYNK